MIELIYCSTFFVNCALSFLLAKTIKNKIKQKRINESKGKNLYSALILPIGALCGTVYFWLVIEVLKKLGQNITYGHGEILIAAVMFNLILSLLLIPFGRMFIGWQKIKL
jgi:hypothetical protein